MILWIAVVGAVCLLVVTIVLYVPIVVFVRGEWSETTRRIKARLRVVHPWVLSLDYDTMHQGMILRVLGRSVAGKHREGEGEGRSGEAPKGRGEEERSPEESMDRDAPESPHDSGAPEPAEDHLSHPPPGGERTGGDDRGEATRSAGRQEDRREGEHTTERQQRRTGIWRRLREAFNRVRNSRVVYVLRSRQWRRRVLRWAGRVIGSARRAVVVDRCDVRVTGGFEDPSVAGKLFGISEGVRCALNAPRPSRTSLRFTPVFDRECLEIRGSTTVRTSAAGLVRPLAVAVVTFPFFRTYHVYRHVKRMGKETATRTKAA